MINIIAMNSMKHTFKLLLNILKKLEIFQATNHYYFGYGANLDSSRFEKYHMSFEIIGSAVLMNHKLEFSLPCEYIGRGYASIKKEKNDNVWGLLYKLSYPSLMMIDILEWVPMNTYTREKLSVEINDHVFQDVWAYIAIYPQKNLYPDEQYFSLILNNSITLNFPQCYIEHIKSHEYKTSFEIDHGFRLSNPGKRRFFEKYLWRLYAQHDALRAWLFPI